MVMYLYSANGTIDSYLNFYNVLLIIRYASIFFSKMLKTFHTMFKGSPYYATTTKNQLNLSIFIFCIVGNFSIFHWHPLDSKFLMETIRNNVSSCLSKVNVIIKYYFSFLLFKNVSMITKVCLENQRTVSMCKIHTPKWRVHMKLKPNKPLPHP